VKEISDLLKPEFVYLDVSGRDKYDVIHKIIVLMSAQHGIEDPALFEEEVVRREEEIPTGLQMGAALPHARSRVVKEIVMAFARLDHGVDFGASDREPARLIFLFGVPSDQINDYLKLVAKLCRLLKVKGFRKKLLSAKKPGEVIELLKES
jgi:fructose-specific phosphotransferase system IIA component